MAIDRSGRFQYTEAKKAMDGMTLPYGPKGLITVLYNEAEGLKLKIDDTSPFAQSIQIKILQKMSPDERPVNCSGAGSNIQRAA